MLQATFAKANKPELLLVLRQRTAQLKAAEQRAQRLEQQLQRVQAENSTLQQLLAAAGDAGAVVISRARALLQEAGEGGIKDLFVNIAKALVERRLPLHHVFYHYLSNAAFNLLQRTTATFDWHPAVKQLARYCMLHHSAKACWRAARGPGGTGVCSSGAVCLHMCRPACSCMQPACLQLHAACLPAAACSLPTDVCNLPACSCVQPVCSCMQPASSCVLPAGISIHVSRDCSASCHPPHSCFKPALQLG